MAVTTADEPSGPDGTPADELPLDVVFDLLRNRRRRLVLRYLRSESESSTLSDLAEHVASIENGKPVDGLTAAERKRAYVALYQCHLPKLDDAGVVDFDGRDAVELTDAAAEVESYLPSDDDSTGSSRERGAATFLAGGGVGVVGSYSVVGLGAGPGVALATLLTAVATVMLRRPHEHDD